MTVICHKRTSSGVVRPIALRAGSIVAIVHCVGVTGQWCTSRAVIIAETGSGGTRLKTIRASGPHGSSHLLREEGGGDQRREDRDEAKKLYLSHCIFPYLQREER